MVLIISRRLPIFSAIFNPKTTQLTSFTAFTGFVLWSTETDRETVFLIQLTSNLKGRIAVPGQLVTIYGRGAANSCGPHRLNRLQGHILYVGRVQLPGEPPRYEIDEHHDFDTTHPNNIANYDCSCEIEIDLPQQRPQDSTVPASDKCVITEREYDCRFRQGLSHSNNCRGMRMRDLYQPAGR